MSLGNIKGWLKQCLNERQQNFLRRLRLQMAAAQARDNLTQLALLYGSDKAGSHHYTQHYQRHFAPLQQRPLNLLEIGVGGYDDPEAGGGSLRMWKSFFPHGKIFGLDYYDKSPLEEERIRIYRGDQSDEQLLRKIATEMGSLDIVIDDGSHFNPHILKSFEVLFPLMPSGGIYVVEDTQTSYWPQFNGTSENLNTTSTAMGFFKSLADGLNHEEFVRPGYVPTYYDRHIVSLHFYHNLIFIYKGENNEGSNFIRNNQLPG